MPSHVGRDPLVIAIDLSTTACKVLAVSGSGDVAAQTRVPLDKVSPKPGWQEQDAPSWWSALCLATRKLMSGIDQKRVRAMSVAHQRETFVCLDEEGSPLRRAILWLDARATAEVDMLGSADVHGVSGRPPSTTPSFYKLAWLRTNEPDVIDRTAMVADVHAYVAHRLTGRWATSWASADALGLIDIHHFTYSPSLLQMVGLREHCLPELVPPGAVLGGVSTEAARATGLPPGLPVIAGAGDGQCAGLGAAVCGGADGYLNLGTAVTLGAHSAECRISPTLRTLASPMAGSWMLESALVSGIHSIEWFRRMVIGDASPEALAAIEAEAADVPAGADGLLFTPYLVHGATPYRDAATRGAWVGLRDYHDRGHLYRAILEGIAFEQRLVVGMLERDLGTPIPRLRVSGGGAGSRLWVQLLADILDRPLEVSGEEVTARGAAVLAALGVASKPASYAQELAVRMAGRWREVLPRASSRKQYRRQGRAYEDLYPSLTPTFRGMAHPPDGV